MHRIKILGNFIHFLDCFFNRKGCSLGFGSLSAWDEGFFVFLQEFTLSNGALDRLSLITCMISLEDWLSDRRCAVTRDEEASRFWRPLKQSLHRLLSLLNMLLHLELGGISGSPSNATTIA